MPWRNHWIRFSVIEKNPLYKCWVITQVNQSLANELQLPGKWEARMSEISQTTRQWGKSKQPPIPRQVCQYWYSFSTGTWESFPTSKTRGRKPEWHGVVARGRLSEFVDARASDRMFSERAVCKQLVSPRGGKDAKQAIDETQARFVASPLHTVLSWSCGFGSSFPQLKGGDNNS